MKTIVGDSGSLPLSPAIKCGSLVFVSGQVPTDEKGQVRGTIKEQTVLVLDKINHLLNLSGSSLEKVVKANVYLADLTDFTDMNEIYSNYFPQAPPTRSCIGVDLLFNAKVEIEVVAIV